MVCFVDNNKQPKVQTTRKHDDQRQFYLKNTFQICTYFKFFLRIPIRSYLFFYFNYMVTQVKTLLNILKV